MATVSAKTSSDLDVVASELQSFRALPQLVLSVRFTYANAGPGAETFAARIGVTAVRYDAFNRYMLLGTIRDARPIDVGLSSEDIDRMIDVNAIGAYFASVEAALRVTEGRAHPWSDGGFSA